MEMLGLFVFMQSHNILLTEAIITRAISNEKGVKLKCPFVVVV